MDYANEPFNRVKKRQEQYNNVLKVMKYLAPITKKEREKGKTKIPIPEELISKFRTPRENTHEYPEPKKLDLTNPPKWFNLLNIQE